MPVEVVSNIYLNYGLIGLVVISLAMLVIWTIKKSDSREEKYISIIEALSNELPEMRATLKRIEHRLERL